MIALIGLLIIGGVMYTMPVDESEIIERQENLGYLLIATSGAYGLYGNNREWDEDVDAEEYINSLKTTANIQYSLLIAGGYMLYRANTLAESAKQERVKEKGERLGDRLKKLEDELKKKKEGDKL
jgi:hypothetical protein|tara:strand:+ start:58 stop:432 length:375 start_codon:yes stop_codon:yes gene_type:complete